MPDRFPRPAAAAAGPIGGQLDGAGYANRLAGPDEESARAPNQPRLRGPGDARARLAQHLEAVRGGRPDSSKPTIPLAHGRLALAPAVHLTSPSFLRMAAPVQPNAPTGAESYNPPRACRKADRQPISATRRGLDMAASNTFGPDEPG